MAAFVGDAGVIGFSGPFDQVPRERVYGISRTALGALRDGGWLLTGQSLHRAASMFNRNVMLGAAKDLGRSMRRSTDVTKAG